MADTELYPIGLGGFNVVSLRADPASATEESVRYNLAVLRTPDNLHLVGVLYVNGEEAKGMVILNGQAVWRDKDFETPFLEMSDEECKEVVRNSFAVHALYDAAALVLRQSFGAMGLSQHIGVGTPEPDVDILHPSEEEPTESERESARRVNED